MLSYTEWANEIKSFDGKIYETNRKIDYRMLQLLGPQPTTDIMSGRSRSYGRTPEENALAQNDMIINRLYAECEALKRQLDYLKRTGCLMEDTDVDHLMDEAFGGDE